jgi:16S rRNA processing protein RimM
LSGDGSRGIGEDLKLSELEAKICVGVVVGAQGLKGAVRIKAFTAEPKDIAAYGPVADESGTRLFQLSVVGEGRGTVIAQLSGISSREQAEALKGLRLFVRRSALPSLAAEEFYHADLIGLEAERADGSPAGKVVAVLDHGGGCYLEIEGGSERPLIVPFSQAAVPVVDLAARKLVIHPPEEVEVRSEENRG